MIDHGTFGRAADGANPGKTLIDQIARGGAPDLVVGKADYVFDRPARQVGDLAARVIEAIAPIPIRLHLHDTRGLAPANAWAGYQAGCRTFDSALGGLGGCPFAPGAAGNVGTEELLYLFGRSGIATGYDLETTLDANRWFATIMGRALPSRAGKAGEQTPDHETGIGDLNCEHSLPICCLSGGTVG